MGINFEVTELRPVNFRMSAIPDVEASASSLERCLPAGCHASVDDGNGVNL